MAACSSGDEVTVGKDLLTVLQDWVKQQEKRKSLTSVNEDGFILVIKESVWTRLFGEYFMQLGNEQDTEVNHEEDDMLFYVRCNPRTTGEEVVVFRRVSKNVPGLGDPHINWEETVYLNLIMHQMEYQLTCAICTRLANRDMKVLKKASVKIYASPHERRMDSKGVESVQSYPNLFFMIDTYDEVFKSLCVRDEEMVCVELVAKDKISGQKAVIFLGSVGYDALKKTYDSKGSFGLKVAQKMSMSWLSNDHDHIEFIRMRGPHGKGFAEIAISQYKPDANEHSSTKRQYWCQCGSTANGDVEFSNSSTTCSMCGLKKEAVDHTGSSVLGAFKWMRTRELIRVDDSRHAGVQVCQGGDFNYQASDWKKSNMVLSTRLTYVNLPWSRIMKDLLEVRQSPVFTR